MKQDNTLTALKFKYLGPVARQIAYPNCPTKTYLGQKTVSNQQKTATRRLADRAAQAASSAGQAIVEYVVLLAVCVVIFTFVFGVIRKQIFILWVCEVYPRIGALQGCRNVDDCWDEFPGDAKKFPECTKAMGQ